MGYCIVTKIQYQFFYRRRIRFAPLMTLTPRSYGVDKILLFIYYPEKQYNDFKDSTFWSNFNPIAFLKPFKFAPVFTSGNGSRRAGNPHWE